MLSGKFSYCINWTKNLIQTKAYHYLDKNKSLGLLDTKISKTKVMKDLLENNAIYIIKCNADNKTQSFKMWPKSFITLFTSSGSSQQIN